MVTLTIFPVIKNAFVLEKNASILAVIIWWNEKKLVNTEMFGYSPDLIFTIKT